MVLPLKVLATREVIRKRLNYKEYIGGIVKEELDWLDWLEGKFSIDAFEVEAEMAGKKLPKKEWMSWLPTSMISYLRGKQDFSISERTGTSGEREWDLQDSDGFVKRMQLSSRFEERKKENGGGGEDQLEFIADGIMITWRCSFGPTGKVLMNEMDCFGIRDKQNLFRETVWHVPKHKITIRRKIWTHRKDTHAAL